jgi:hypothetical protein
MKDKREWKPKERPKPVCHRIGCTRMATRGILCDRHDSEMNTLGQPLDEYRAKNCVDKSREAWRDRSKKKKAAPRFARQTEDDE